MRRFFTVAVAAIMTLVLAGGAATAAQHDHDHEELPEHPHVLVVGVEYEEVETPEGVERVAVAYKNCIDLAANQALKLNAHHHNVHFGTPNMKFFENLDGRNLVIPMAPFPGVPFANCDELIEMSGVERSVGR